MVERMVRIHEAQGSIPWISTFLISLQPLVQFVTNEYVQYMLRLHMGKGRNSEMTNVSNKRSVKSLSRWCTISGRDDVFSNFMSFNGICTCNLLFQSNFTSRHRRLLAFRGNHIWFGCLTFFVVVLALLCEYLLFFEVHKGASEVEVLAGWIISEYLRLWIQHPVDWLPYFVNIYMGSQAGLHGLFHGFRSNHITLMDTSSRGWSTCAVTTSQ
jgi:hypothetical protein